jgi:hypothetical protein
VRDASGLRTQALILLPVVLALNILHAQWLAVGFSFVALAMGIALYLVRVRILAGREGRTDLRFWASPFDPKDPTGPFLRADPRPLIWPAVIFLAAILPIHLPFQTAWPSELSVDTATGIAAALATALASIFISTFVDYYYVGPLMRENVEEEFMLCRSSLTARWRTVTKFWLFHRLGAILGFVLGLVAAVTLSALPIVNFNQVAAGAVAALTTILAGFYLVRARDVIAFAVRPAFHVGDKIQLDGDGEDRERMYFVVDVAMEGVRLLELTGPNDEVPNVLESRREHDRILDFSEAAQVLRCRRRFKPCGQKECKRVNAYCPRRELAQPEVDCAAPKEQALG